MKNYLRSLANGTTNGCHYATDYQLLKRFYTEKQQAERCHDWIRPEQSLQDIVKRCLKIYDFSALKSFFADPPLLLQTSVAYQIVRLNQYHAEVIGYERTFILNSLRSRPYSPKTLKTKLRERLTRACTYIELHYNQTLGECADELNFTIETAVSYGRMRTLRRKISKLELLSHESYDPQLCKELNSFRKEYENARTEYFMREDEFLAWRIAFYAFLNRLHSDKKKLQRLIARYY